MERRRSVAFVLVCSLLIVAVAGCGKKGKREEESQKGTEIGSVEEYTPEETVTVTEQEQETQGDALAGGSTQDLVYQVLQEQRQYEAEDKTPIFTVKLTYPVLEGEAAGTEEINRFFEDWKDRKLEEYEADTDSTRQNALEVYRESRDIGWPGPWSEEYQVSKVKAYQGYVSILIDSYLYEGGAHGMPYRETYMFRLEDGVWADLEQMSGRLGSDWEADLKMRFLERIGQAQEADFYKDASEILEGKKLDDFGYYFDDDGIVFYLPPYEIAPYSTGYVEVTIPWEEAF